MKIYQLFYFLILTVYCGGVVASNTPEIGNGVAENTQYGYNYEGIRSHPESASFEFQYAGTGGLELSLETYDIDFSDENQILVNSVSIGYLPVTSNNAAGFARITIPHNLLISGKNSITFKQKGSRWTWGITNLLLEPSQSTTLQVSVINNTKFGYKYEGIRSHPESASFEFQYAGTGGLELSLETYDIDFSDENQILVNSVSIGYLPVTSNNAAGFARITIPHNLLISGKNSITFKQKGSRWTWGITNLLLEPSQSTTLQVSVINNTKFGYKYEGIRSHPESASFEFQYAGTGGLELSLETYDIDFSDENQILVNSVSIGYLPVTSNNAAGFARITIPHNLLISGKNSITFKQKGSRWTWGITNLLLEPSQSTTLQVSVINNTKFGYKYEGIRSHPESASFEFQYAGTGGLELSLETYDIDFSDENQILVNSVSIGYLPVTSNNAAGFARITIPHNLLISGKNSITFKQKGSRWTWGITNLLLERIENDDGGPFPPEIPLPLAPLAAANIKLGSNVTFAWQPVPFAQAYEFLLSESLASQTTFTLTELFPSVVCNEALCSVDVIVNLPVAQRHTWSVRARNSAGASDYSVTEFNVVEPVTDTPEPPVITAPLQGENVYTESDVTFSWQPALLAASYEFELIGSTDQPIDPTLTITQLVPSSSCDESVCTAVVNLNLPGGNTYTWRVRAVNSIGASDWAESSVYAIQASTEKPSITTTIAPVANTDLIVGNTVVFRWQHDPQVVTYDFRFFNNEPPDKGPVQETLGLRPQDICVNQQCEFAEEVGVPVFANHAWRVRANNALGNLGWSRTTFNAVELITEAPVVPIPVSPIDNALLETTTTVLFTWQPADTATQYEFELLNPAIAAFEPISAFIPAAQCSDTACNVSITLDVDVDPNYQWQVRARNAVGPSPWVTSDFEVINLATERPPITVNLLPEREVLLTAGDTVNFTWERDPHSVTYEFHFFNNAEGSQTPFVTGLIPDDICVANICELSQTLDQLPIAEGHAWRVRGRNSLGFPDWSRSSFDLIEPVTEPPGPFTLNLPLPGADVAQDSDISFVWSAALRAASYEIAIIDGTLAEPVLDPISVLATACDDELCRYTSTATLPLSSEHSWQVRAINPIGTSEWQTSTFAVVETVVEPPSTPVVIAPLAEASVITGQTVDFQWQADSEASSYEFYITDAINGVLDVVADLQPGTLCSDGVCSYSIPFSLPVSDIFHTWHVRVRHANDAVSAWSQRAIRVIEDTGTGEPTAAFTIAGFSGDAFGLAPLSLSFDPSASFDDVGIVSYAWDFGDASPPETTASEQIVEHIYTAPGNYTATLTVTDAAGITDSAELMVTAIDPVNAVSAEEASRLLTQASFGPTRQSILQVQALGIENWIDQQFAREGPAHLPYVQQYSNNSNRAARHEVWWLDVVTGEDQLRQRVAFALSQIFVVSDTGYTLSNAQYGVTHYYDLLRDNAFGNYRDLLESVTLNPVMGLYLSMLQNAKNDEVANTRADENYAREVLQLFSIGLYQLNNDGTTNGAQAFTQENVEAFARAFTGWNYADAGRWDRKLFTGADMISPMRPFEAYHDVDPKTLLNNQTSPAFQSARQDLDFALDNIFNHANVGPFMAKQLIKRLVTSNPSPAYVDRVASVFNDDGFGVRGNLQEVVRAILLDVEARTIPASDNYGKLREPVLRLSHLWRAFNVIKGSQSVRGEFNTTSPKMENLDEVTGQAVLRSPSVFNFFQPSYSPAGPVADQNLVAPEFELFTESNELATSNRIGHQIQVAFLSNTASNARTGSHLDFTYEISIAGDVEQLLEHLNVLLVGGNLRASTLVTLSDHLNSFPDTADGRSQRVRDAVTLIMASPDYLIQQ